jgi:hypothetical protein
VNVIGDVHEPIICGATWFDRNVTSVCVVPPTAAGTSSFEGGAEHVSKLAHVQTLLHVRWWYVSGCTQPAFANSLVPGEQELAG